MSFSPKIPPLWTSTPQTTIQTIYPSRDISALTHIRNTFPPPPHSSTHLIHKTPLGQKLYDKYAKKVLVSEGKVDGFERVEVAHPSCCVAEPPGKRIVAGCSLEVRGKDIEGCGSVVRSGRQKRTNALG